MNKILMTMFVVFSLLLAACVQQRGPPAPPIQVAEPAAQAPAPVQTETVAPSPAPAPEPEVTMQSKSFTILASDAKAAPMNINVDKGTKFRITFKVDASGVYYGGLQFKSSKFDSGKVSAGSTWTSPELTADESFAIGAYWPAAGVHKWDVQVTVS